MEKKTNVEADEGKQQLTITREFELPVELLYKAYTDPEIVGQWMGTRVLKLENHPHGSWHFETSDPQGNVVFRSNGVIIELEPNQKIIRTFKMMDAPPEMLFDVQLEFLEFKKLTDQTSKLTILMIFKSVAHRDQLLSMPFAQGLNMAHNKLEKLLSTNA